MPLRPEFEDAVDTAAARVAFGLSATTPVVLAMAGSIAAKPKLAPSAGTLPAHGLLFVSLLIGVILIMGGLQFFPALALGPIVEHFQALTAVHAIH